MAIMRVSRSASVIALCAAAWLPACATTTADDEIRKLEARASYEAGVKSISEGRISLGLSSLRQAVEIEPRNPIYHNAVGAVMLNIGRYQDAQLEFQKAVELDPTYADAFHNLGSAYAEQAKWEDAIVAYRKALAQTIYNRPETTYNNLGYAYWALWPGRSLFRTTRPPPIISANLPASLARPVSGATATRSTSVPSRSRTCCANIGTATMWSTGIVKKPCTWPAWRSIVITRSTPTVSSRSATMRAVIGSRGRDFLSWRA